MHRYLQEKFGLSEKGAKDFVRGGLYSAFLNISMMIPAGIFIMMLYELLKPISIGKINIPSIWKYIGLVIFSGIVICIFNYLQYSVVFISTYRESASRRITLAEKLRQLPLSFFGKKDLSDLTNSIMEDCTRLEHAFSHAIPQLFGAVISTIIMVIGLLIIDFRMGLSVIWVIPIAFIIIFASKKAQQKSGLKYYNAKRVCADGIQECLENIQDIKAYNVGESYIKGLDKKLDDAEKAQIQSELTLGSFVNSSQAVLRLGLATVILVGGTLLINKEIDLLTYLIFLIASSRLYDPLAGTLANIAEIFSVQIPIERMKDMENHKVQSGRKNFSLKGFDIKFENVAFSYNENEQVLKDISFVADQQNVTALVGPSGGGKSTVAKLAARFWDLDKGLITLGGEDISQIDPEELLKNYSIVFQDVTLFDDTIMENIRLGRREATDKEVLNAAKLAMCDDFVLKLPKGYQSVIGENGFRLSGGERQRLSIARALLKDAPVILLDEATASLDVENETKIQTAISELIKNKTVLVIAHRLRTIVGADKIVVLGEGTVLEEGTHQELMNKEGLYSRLYKLQQESVEWSL